MEEWCRFVVVARNEVRVDRQPDSTNEWVSGRLVGTSSRACKGPFVAKLATLGQPPVNGLARDAGPRSKLVGQRQDQVAANDCRLYAGRLTGTGGDAVHPLLSIHAQLADSEP